VQLPLLFFSAWLHVSALESLARQLAPATPLASSVKLSSEVELLVSLDADYP
jgi:hypothetical protein